MSDDHIWTMSDDSSLIVPPSLEEFVTDGSESEQESWEASSEDSDFASKKKRNGKEKKEKKHKVRLYLWKLLDFYIVKS